MSKLVFGEPAPFFEAQSSANPHYNFGTVAGRPVFLVFVGAPAGPAARRLVAEVKALRPAFDDDNLTLFYVVSNHGQLAELDIDQSLPGIRYFLDADNRIAALFGFAPTETALVLLDRTLRCLQSLVVGEADTRPLLGLLVDNTRALMAWQRTAPSIDHAPVLVVERIFEPPFCRALIDYYKARGGEESGFMREEDGLTIGRLDHAFKRRCDCQIEDERLRNDAMFRLYRRLVPMIRRAYQYEPTRIERHIVARYDAEEGGFFRPHRDNTTKGTAHRRFAVTINLNAEDYEGGDLRLPEFGRQAYRAPTGGALVFSCSLLHEALPVTKGARYAYLPFLYGEEEAELRRQNERFLDKASGGQADATARATK